jgi:hypothetical protein
LYPENGIWYFVNDRNNKWSDYTTP